MFLLLDRFFHPLMLALSLLKHLQLVDHRACGLLTGALVVGNDSLHHRARANHSQLPHMGF
jgi:hypothetical protein